MLRFKASSLMGGADRHQHVARSIAGGGGVFIWISLCTLCALCVSVVKKFA